MNRFCGGRAEGVGRGGTRRESRCVGIGSGEAVDRGLR